MTFRLVVLLIGVALIAFVLADRSIFGDILARIALVVCVAAATGAAIAALPPPARRRAR
ncbi:MAG: hypothetical protein KJS97_07680 [Alphaproteobacteria bacterium]|nr:hypothetical protein [Alphaproteobacteria bacterium]